jgi:hypothetical protein
MSGHIAFYIHPASCRCILSPANQGTAVVSDGVVLQVKVVVPGVVASDHVICRRVDDYDGMNVTIIITYP